MNLVGYLPMTLMLIGGFIVNKKRKIMSLTRALIFYMSSYEASKTILNALQWRKIMNKLMDTIEGKIAFAIIMIVVLMFVWLRPVKHEVKIQLSKNELETNNEYPSFGDWYTPGTKLGETRVYDERGNYMGSVLNDPEMSTSYYWWIPENMVYEEALDLIEVDATWYNAKFVDMFGTNFIVGTEVH